MSVSDSVISGIRYGCSAALICTNQAAVNVTSFDYHQNTEEIKHRQVHRTKHTNIHTMLKH